MFSVWNYGTNLLTSLFRNILARYLHSITNYNKMKHGVRTNSISILSELSVYVMFWGTVSQNCCRNILGLLPKGATPTALNRLSLCLRLIFLGLTPMNVLISIVIPANTMLGDFFHCSNDIYQHLMTCIFPIVTYMWPMLECLVVCMDICWYDGQNVNGHQNVWHSCPCALSQGGIYVSGQAWPTWCTCINLYWI